MTLLLPTAIIDTEDDRLRFLSTFSGIGGLDLGLEMAGWECIGQVENDPWCTKILERHWPNVPRWSDIHDLSPTDIPDCDAIVGGFPCQPVSLAGKREAQDDPRWRWPEFFRIVRSIRPRYVIVENVPGLASAGLGDVLGDLASVGYDTEWQSIPAAAVGAPHLRWRIFIIAYPKRNPVRVEPVAEPRSGSTTIVRDDGPLQPMANTNGERRERRAGSARPGRGRQPAHSNWWSIEPGMGRVANGVPGRVDRLRGLGNAVVPQVAEWVGQMINQFEATQQ